MDIIFNMYSNLKSGNLQVTLEPTRWLPSGVGILPKQTSKGQ